MIGFCRTDGSGLWSDKEKIVSVMRLDISYLNNKNLYYSTHGELRAYFDLNSWNTPVDGLIYTDDLWMFDFKTLLKAGGFSDMAIDAVHYSEQGMQGIDFVSMDIGRPFITECDYLLNFLDEREITIKIDVKSR